MPGDIERAKIVITNYHALDRSVRSRSKWFEGPVGWVLSRPKKLKFIPLKGRLGLFDAPQAIIRNLVGPRGGEVR
jgi:hypothetical protein